MMTDFKLDVVCHGMTVISHDVDGADPYQVISCVPNMRILWFSHHCAAICVFLIFLMILVCDMQVVNVKCVVYIHIMDKYR